MFGMSYFLCIFVIQKATQKSPGRSLLTDKHQGKVIKSDTKLLNHSQL